jgi:hypothetical protein
VQPGEADHGALRRDPRAIWRALPDGVLVLGPGHRDPVAILGPAAEVWVLLAEPASVATLAATLEARYAGAAAEVRAGVEQVVDALRANHALVSA